MGRPACARPSSAGAAKARATRAHDSIPAIPREVSTRSGASAAGATDHVSALVSTKAQNAGTRADAPHRRSAATPAPIVSSAAAAETRATLDTPGLQATGATVTPHA